MMMTTMTTTMKNDDYTNEDDWDDENTNSVCVNRGNKFQLGYLRK